MRSKPSIALNAKAVFRTRIETYRNVHLDTHAHDPSDFFRSFTSRLGRETHSPTPLISLEPLSCGSNVPLPTPSMERQSEPTQGTNTKCELKLSGTFTLIFSKFRRYQWRPPFTLSAPVTEKVRVIKVQSLIEPRKQQPVSCMQDPDAPLRKTGGR